MRFKYSSFYFALYSGVSTYVGLYGSGLLNFRSYVNLPTLFACFLGFHHFTSLHLSPFLLKMFLLFLQYTGLLIMYHAFIYMYIHTYIIHIYTHTYYICTYVTKRLLSMYCFSSWCKLLYVLSLIHVLLVLITVLLFLLLASSFFFCLLLVSVYKQSHFLLS